MYNYIRLIGIKHKIFVSIKNILKQHILKWQNTEMKEKNYKNTFNECT